MVLTDPPSKSLALGGQSGIYLESIPNKHLSERPNEADDFENVVAIPSDKYAPIPAPGADSIPTPPHSREYQPPDVPDPYQSMTISSGEAEEPASINKM